jgi:hypothetical protein
MRNGSSLPPVQKTQTVGALASPTEFRSPARLHIRLAESTRRSERKLSLAQAAPTTVVFGVNQLNAV